MNKYIFSLTVITAGCFSDPGGSSIGDGSDETGTDGGSETSGDGEASSSGGSSGTASGGDDGSSGVDGGNTTTDESYTSSESNTITDESNTPSASDTSSTSGTQSMCPLGMAFNQDYCWAVAECDPVLCTHEGGWECKTNIETCAAYGLEPTVEKIFLEEWNEGVAQDLVDQLGLDGIDEPSGGAASSMWNTELNTIGTWGYGSGVEYSNVPICTQFNLYVYWPIHTCFPE